MAVGTMTKIFGLSNKPQADAKMDEIRKIQAEIKNNQELIKNSNLNSTSTNK